MDLGGSMLRGLIHPSDARRRRASSWDTSGRNVDHLTLEPGETLTLLDVSGAGMITHIWMTSRAEERAWTRRVVLRAYWDGEEQPSIEAPIGDFFGCGHGAIRQYWSLPLDMSGPDNANHSAFNCWWPMPFGNGARMTVTNESDTRRAWYFYIDYEEHERVDPDALRFHAQWRRCCPCQGWVKPYQSVFDRDTDSVANLSAKDNYVILEAQGRGHYVGCNLSVDNWVGEWWGEGDDMIFIDGDTWPPSLHGTGTEDYFCHAYGMQNAYGPYHGVSVMNREHRNWEGQFTVYRYHVADPVQFREQIRVTIEHGHANGRGDDYASTAYWYQTEPHGQFPALPPVAQRLPRRL